MVNLTFSWNNSRCHPGPGQPHSTGVVETAALQEIEVEYFGHT